MQNTNVDNIKTKIDSPPYLQQPYHNSKKCQTDIKYANSSQKTLQKVESFIQHNK